MREITSEWWNGPAVAWLAWGILNPFGPTLNVLGMKNDGSKHQTFLRTFHFTGGSTIEGDPFDGPTNLQDIVEQTRKIDEYRQEEKNCSLFATIPSFVLFRHDDTAMKQLFMELLFEFGGLDLDWSTEISAVRRFGTKFWDRASFDMGAGLDPSGTDRVESGVLEEADIDAWLQTVSADDFSRSAFQNFVAMWKGASQQTPGLVKVKEIEILKFLLRTDLLSARFLPKKVVAG